VLKTPVFKFLFVCVRGGRPTTVPFVNTSPESDLLALYLFEGHMSQELLGKMACSMGACHLAFVARNVSRAFSMRNVLPSVTNLRSTVCVNDSLFVFVCVHVCFVSVIVYNILICSLIKR